jgi:UDP-N-acetylmuramoyl-tripeptide--D-alanyl-D-alanine ligase
MARTLSAVAREVRGRLIGADRAFGAVGTDTRALPPGALFVAIKGARFDGNDFVGKAAERGAAGALVSRPADLPLAQIEVDDTVRAFGAMAQAWRANFSIPVVAVTGSAGKTTVKELIASILARRLLVCVTQGNLNNEIGVPLSLMRLAARDEAMVVELGANHAGEIAYLGRLVAPTIAVITNAGAAHLEGFGSIAGVAAAKGELIDCLPADGVAVLNADDAFFADWRRRAGQRRVTSFGTAAGADVRLIGTPAANGETSRFALALPDGTTIAISSALVGRANVANALAAAAAAWTAGATPAEIERGLAAARPVQGRMNLMRGALGATLIDDSYNANPSAAMAALDYLAERPGRRILVLGDMKELGADAPRLHREIGEYARGRADDVVAIGALAAEAARAFGPNAPVCADLDEARAAIEARLAADVTVLIKGSRSMGLERLVAALAQGAPAASPGVRPC